MDHDKNGVPIEEDKVPSIVDKLGPVQEIRKRRMRLNFSIMAAAQHSPDVPPALYREEHSIFIDALEYVEVFSEDAFCRLMARHALGRRPR